MNWKPIEEFKWEPMKLVCWHGRGWDTFHVPRQYKNEDGTLDLESGEAQWEKMIRAYGITHYCIPSKP